MVAGRLLLILAFLGLQTGCVAPASLTPTAAPATQQPSPVTSAPASSPSPGVSPTPSLEPDSTPTPSPTRTASPTPTPPVPSASGPDYYPPGINPLTGLPVKDPLTLLIPPALMSFTEFPPTARPQAGLSYAPIIYEFFMGAGMSRYLAVFYGDMPWEEAKAAKKVNPIAIGPLRSGRLHYEQLRQLFEGFLVFASAAPAVLRVLKEYTIFLGDDAADINAAMVSEEDFNRIALDAQRSLKPPNPVGLLFDPLPPTGGKPASTLWVGFSTLDQILWRYDPSSGSYLRWQDEMDGKTFTLATDRLTGTPLTFENVVVIWAQYHFYHETYFNIDLLYRYRDPAFFLRDGQLHEGYWTTTSGEYEKQTGRLRPIRFLDKKGNPFPLKPGQTFVETVSTLSPYHETVADLDYRLKSTRRQPGSGEWAVTYARTAFEPTPTP